MGHFELMKVSGLIRAESNKSKDVNSKVIYWHRALSPFESEMVTEHTMEATRWRVPGNLVHWDELPNRCYEDLMVQTCVRFEQKVARLGGHSTHIFDESVDRRHDDLVGEA
jgi:hypothetical protein